ncbi:MAG: ribosomal L7Ae/L30e/S12e/Gadd45 family protein [Clostridia bacterium]|nr:ribosomal L7Ae/L30e/S12e/Gadd45 family protein [Clostridia bacterium]
MKDKEEMCPAKERQLPQIPDDPKEAEMLLAQLQQRKKLAGLLGIAKKGGRVVAGTNLVTDAIRAGRAKGCPCAVFLACDASENTKKRVGNCCTYYEIPLYPTALTGAELGSAIGRAGITAAVGITDMGLAEALKKLLPNSDDCLPRKE